MNPAASMPPKASVAKPEPSGARLLAAVGAADALRVVPLHHPVLDALGHDSRSAYGELFLLPLVGPTTLWAHRRLCLHLARRPDGFEVPLAVLAGELGVGTGRGRNSPVVKAIGRLVDWDLAEFTAGTLAVRPVIPPLTAGQVRRLPEHLRALHRRQAAIRPALAHGHRRVSGAGIEIVS